MDFLRELPGKLLDPIAYPFSSESRIYWLYLAGAFVLAFAAHRALGRGGRAEPGGGTFLRYVFPKAVYAHRSAIVDYKYYVVGRLIRAFGLMPLLIATPAVADWTVHRLERLFGPVEATGTPGAGARLLYTLAVMVAFDFGVFVAHTLQHRVPVLWEFHKVHHSAEILTPITLYRMHPVDDIVAGSVAALAVGTAAGGFAWALGGPVGEVLAGGVNLGLFLFYLFGYNLRHSHVWLHYPAWLARFLLSPAQHQIHHSRDAKHVNRNMGFVFSFWDRMANTLYVPAERETLELGLGGGEDDEYRTVTACYLLPFRKAAAVVFRGLRPGRRPT